MKKIAEINTGDKAEIKHIITEEDIKRFVELTGDDNKLHIDNEFASKTAFKKPVVHGMLGASFISTVIGTKIPGDGALWYAQNLEFLLPIRVGDEITVIAEVIKKYERDNLIELRTDIFNQHKQKVTTGIAKVKILEQKDDKDITSKKVVRKIVLVVGGTGGIGRATCLQLAKDGFDVIVHYNQNEEYARQIKDDIEKMGRKVMTVRADIVNDFQVKEMIEKISRRFDTVTVLVNCSTIKIQHIKFALLEWNDIQRHIDMNIKGSFNLIKHIMPFMEKEGYGKVINVTTQSVETPNPQWLHYITAKSGLTGFSKALAVELAPKGIRVNMVSPGMTDTELIADIPEKVRLLTEARTPLKRLAKPEDIACVISFLASERSDFLTGETIRVNGGQVMI